MRQSTGVKRAGVIRHLITRLPEHAVGTDACPGTTEIINQGGLKIQYTLRRASDRRSMAGVALYCLAGGVVQQLRQRPGRLFARMPGLVLGLARSTRRL